MNRIEKLEIKISLRGIKYMVVIRLARVGSTKKPFYHIVVTEKRMKRNGRFIERVGFYNPVNQGKAHPYFLALERIEDWLNKGAQPSDTVHSLLKLVRKNGNPVEANLAIV